MFDHDPGRPHPSLIDLASRRAAMADRTTVPSASTRPADPIHLHLRRPRWEPVNVADPESALRSTIAQATQEPLVVGPIEHSYKDFDNEGNRRFVTLRADDEKGGTKTDARTADMRGGIGKALEDAEQEGYVRGHKHGLEQAVLVEKIDFIAIGTISGFIGGWVLFVGLPAFMRWVG